MSSNCMFYAIRYAATNVFKTKTIPKQTQKILKLFDFWFSYKFVSFTSIDFKNRLFEARKKKNVQRAAAYLLVKKEFDLKQSL